MLVDGKEKAQGVAVVDLLRPAGLFCFSMDSAKIMRFLWEFFPNLIKQLERYRANAGFYGVGGDNRRLYGACD